ATDAPFSRLCRTFALEGRERDVLAAAIAAALQPELGRLCAYLHDNGSRPYLSDEIVSRLYGPARCGWWDEGTRLARWEIVSSHAVSAVDPPALRLDPGLIPFLAGERGVDPEILPYLRGVTPRDPLPGWPVAETARRIERALDGPARGVWIEVAAPRGHGRRTFAATVASALGLTCLGFELPPLSLTDWTRVRLRAQRLAFLEGSTPVWSGACAELDWAADMPLFPIQWFAVLPHQHVAAPPGVARVRVELPEPSAAERASLWLAATPDARDWPRATLDRLARRYRAGVGEIATAAASAPADAAEAAEALRAVSRGTTGTLMKRMETPFDWDDLVLGRRVLDALHDLVHEADDRSWLWEDRARRRLFPQGRGLFALFSGPPGTGKTMAAQVMARALEMDLYRIDLSAVVSKYVGETSQNLQRVLSEAPEHAVLLFDEADALFGKRTEIRDAHDRYANTDTNHLLQAVESYRGIALLATNRKDNVDPAFLRRLRYVIEFPPPNAEQREALWRKLTSELTGGVDVHGVDDAWLRTLAGTLELTGAQIKGSILAATLRARRLSEPLSAEHLLHGIDRELMKEGRALSEREQERLAVRGRSQRRHGG
ncbi:MAG TPA: AAA family ATPase, partial [Longimicrobiales bacterium]|nr:AAA family ATPase [Longimicrobiales bacterium]